jgi:nucleotide-binding universal stress UspA family protein
MSGPTAAKTTSDEVYRVTILCEVLYLRRKIGQSCSEGSGPGQTYEFSQKSIASPAAGITLAGESDQLAKIIPPLNLKTILVPTDFSENAKKALIYAVRIAQRNDSNLILFHVFELSEFVRQLPQDFSYKFNEKLAKLCDEATRRSEEKLVALSRAVRESNVKTETRQRLGTPDEEIVKVARERSVDLIVMATHGYTGFKHFLLGSTAERVVNDSPCPVLVVRQEERDFVS